MIIKTYEGVALALLGKIKGIFTKNLKNKIAASRIDGLFQGAAEIEGVRVVTAYLAGTTPDALRSMSEMIRDRAPDTVSALVGSVEGKITLAVSCGADCLKKGLKAGVLVKAIAAIAGGNGGGKPDFAMAGLKDAGKIDDALHAAPEIVKANIKA